MTQAILQALREFGPMTTAELAVHLGFKSARPQMSVLRKRNPDAVHIVAWTRDDERMNRYLRAVYAIGPGKDAKRPKSTRECPQAAREYRERRNARKTANFVFHMGLSPKTMTPRVKSR